MIKTCLKAGLPLTALIVGVSALSAQDADSKMAPPKSDFAPIERFAIAYEEPRQMAEFYVRDYGINPYDAEYKELRDPEDPYMRVWMVTVDGIADNSVKGIQFRLGLRADRGSWRTIDAGVRRKCYRGENVDSWTTDTCP